MLWDPGLLIEYTDESWAYGNNGVSYHPGQHYLDSTPELVESALLGVVVTGESPGDCDQVEDAVCNDASFTDADGDTRFSDAEVWQDNFEDPSRETGRWEFDYGCLTSEVLSMAGEDTVQLEPDLTADVRLTAGDGCVAYTYGRALAAGATVTPPEPEPRSAPEPEPDRAPLPATGGGLGLLAVGLLAGAGITTQRRRRC